jgi:hypothetical protein
MLATLAALQLFVLAQTTPADPGVAPPAEGKLSDDPGAVDQAPPRDTNPPLPRRPGAPPPTGATEAGQEGATQEPQPGTEPAPRENLPAPRTIRVDPPSGAQLSLLSAEPLGGGSALLAQAGWSQLSIMWAQGVTREDDLGASLDLDWAYTELRLGAFYRKPLGPAGPFTMGGRLGVSWYNAFGGSWIYGGNHKDRGFEVAPALSLSSHAGGGILSIIGEAPVTVTLRSGSGLLFSPRLSLAYEAPLYDEYTLGARIGLGYRAGAGDAPLADGRAQLMFLVVGGYRLF